MPAILMLVLAIALFGATHLVPVVPAWKAALKRRLGRAYAPVFVLLSVGSITLVILAYASAPFIPLYDPPPWGAHVTFTLMFFAFLLFGVFLYPCRLKKKLRTPFAWVVLLWGAGHLFANGDAATVVLAGGLMLVAALMLWLAWRNGFVPEGRADPMLDYAALLTGAILYLGMIMAHEALIGVPVLPYVMAG